MMEAGKFWDEDAWLKYPQYHKWFNKLYVAEHFGYRCGPAGLKVPCPDNYVVRPIYNLAGMGLYAAVLYLTPEDTHFIQPGYFWVEYFNGTHYSIDYLKVNGEFHQVVNFIGVNRPENLSLFTSWTQTDYQFTLPDSLNELDVECLNIEVIGDKIVEVHLRSGFLHLKQYQQLIPVFDHQPTSKFGYTFIEEYDDAKGHLPIKRLGYLVKQ
jgi:hypothetical protein